MAQMSIAPIIISAFGFGFESKIVVAGLIAFFPIFVNTLTGLLMPDPQEEELFRSLGAGRAQTFVHVLLPTAAPLMFAGLIVISIMAMVMYVAFAALERRMTGWAHRGMNMPS